MGFCHDCGTAVTSLQKFCPKCGKQVIADAPPPEKGIVPQGGAEHRDLDVSSPAILEAWKDLQSASTSTNWVLYSVGGVGSTRGQDNTLSVLAKGSGGFTALKAKLNEADTKGRITCGGFLVVAEDRKDNLVSKRDKFVYFSCVGSAVPDVSAGHFNFSKRRLLSMFVPVHLTLDLKSSDMDIFNETQLANRLLVAGAAHKPTHFDFGGGNVVPLAQAEARDEEQDSDADFD